LEAHAIVVIPSYGPLHQVERCLDSLTRCRGVETVEVRVVHSGPEPVQSPLGAAGLKVRAIQSSERLFAGAARNRGVREGPPAEIILFIDADCVAEPNWIEAHLHAHRQGATLVTGPVLPGPPDAPTGLAEYLVEFAFTRMAPALEQFRSAPACNFSIRRDLFERMGGFPDNPTGQDLLFNLRLCAQGHRVLFSSAATMFHCCRAESGAYLANRERIGRGLGRVTRQAEREGLLNRGVGSEYRFLRTICRSPWGLLLLPSKLFRLAVLILRGDLSILRYVLSCPLSLLRGLWVESRACRSGYLEESSPR
jgi:GT2 family glycosyltransferase